ncbi:hypothetical protein HS961_01410 [Comamonas piscis]|uniref:Uncharacterized protein n=1 Tax=Comamonas piscis TaxID=1562974 RepID=A0A7G5EC73_9BURK|nr:hypothetical protein [Comamonas piscis]QMV71598.1 hypothetical protein HS961_01410 [Comamonas piscis]WSO34316.1 hypothetical protein VUJ63_01415 [Comamonas piscis]
MAAVLRVDIAAVLALPDDGHRAWQCEVQVRRPRQHFGAELRIDGVANALAILFALCLAAGADGACDTALSADQNRPGTGDDPCVFDLVIDAGCGLSGHANSYQKLKNDSS